jgi:uncharacterized protein
MVRIVTLDVLRGFALFGIIFINIRQMVFSWTMNSSMLDDRINEILSAAVSHRFFVIFSFLFGVGFYMFLSRAEKRGERPRVLFLRRLLFLFLIGIVHHYFQPGEALLYYSIIGLLLIPFYKTKVSVIFIAGILMIAAGCYLGFPFMILGMFLLGHWAGKIGLFQQTEKYIRPLRITLIISLLSIVPFYMLQQDILRTGQLDLALAIGGLPLSIFYVTLITLLMQHKVFRTLFTPLGKIGQMALTNYLLQTLLILTLAGLLNWQGKVTSLELVIASFSILAGQMMLSAWWLRYYRTGPIEFLWRWATYGRRGKLRKPAEL